MLSVASMMSLGDIDSFDDEHQTVNPTMKRVSQFSGSTNELGKLSFNIFIFLEI